MGVLSDPIDAAQDVQDVVIIGAGPAGINATYRFQEQLPNLKCTILERRGAVGGTWDFFRYPGLRSDTDFYTYAFQWRPWLSEKTMIDGESIRQYLVDAAHEIGLDKRIRFHHEVTRASWSSEKQMWTLYCLVNGVSETTFHTRFVFWASGWFSYTHPLPAPISGIENFKGVVAHTQFWPQDLDYTGKNIVVIGSGATAVTVVPALAEKAKKVTMLQRTPSYIIPVPANDPRILFLCRWLPVWVASAVIRLIWMLTMSAMDIYSRHFPQKTRGLLEKMAKSELPPDYPFNPHFDPPYPPMEQRPCLCPDGNFYAAIRQGKVDIATGIIDTCTKGGLRLTSGQIIDDVDIIVTATGMEMQTAGGAQIVVDGKEIIPGDLFFWRGAMVQDVPNTGMGFGYPPFGWTLGADSATTLFIRVIKHARSRGYSSVVPRLDLKYTGMKPSPMIKSASTYNKLSGRNLPQSGERGPWAARWNHLYEVWKLMFHSDTDGLVFSKS